jgi:integrase
MANIRRAIKALRETYGTLSAKDFSPLKLKLVRDRLIADGLARVTANRHVSIIGRIFAYGVENELVPAEIWHAIKSVKPLAKGRSSARETDPVLPVPDADVEATLPFLKAPFDTMVKVQTILACRPGELCAMALEQIDRSGDIWLYRPRVHKTMHREKARLIPIGPRAQLLLRPHLPAFGTHVFRNPRTGGRVTVACYTAIVARAACKAGVDHWSPNQLRHAGATKIREQASLDAAQIILGHSAITTSQVYAEKNLRAALEIAAKIG